MPGRTASLLVCILLALSAPAFALDLALDVSQYAHTAWKIREGFTPGAITSIAQTPDGYLWLGTPYGLFRFDGLRTVPWVPPGDRHLPSDRILSLRAGRDRTLWIGTDKGLASWKGSEVKTYPELGESSVFTLLEDRQGAIWAGTLGVVGALQGTLCEIKDGKVNCARADSRLRVTALFEDDRGVLWVGVVGGLWRWKPGTPQFYPLPDVRDDGVQGLTQDSDGLLFGSKAGVRRFVSGKAEPYRLPNTTDRFGTRRLLFDNDGGLWIGTETGGLVHLHQGRVDRFGQGDGLSGDNAYALFEDREGNIWFSSNNGLDRFRDVAAATFTRRQGVTNAAVPSVLADRQGTVWLGTQSGLKRWDRGQPIGRDVGQRLSGVGITSLLEDDVGRIWIGTLEGVGYLENDGFSYVAGLPGGVMHAMVQDSAGNIWIANQDAGLFQVSDGRPVRRIPWASLGAQGYALSMVADRHGGVWFGFPRGGLAYFADGGYRVSYPPGNGLGSGRVLDLRLEEDGTLWAATEGGLSRLKNGRSATLTRQNGLPCDAVWWVIEDDARSFWVETPCGLVRVARAGLDAWASAVDSSLDAAHTLQVTVFDHSEGVRASGFSAYSPHAAKATDGRIWYHGADGVNVIDPRQIRVNTLPPPVSIEQIVADRHAYDTLLNGGATTLDLPALTRDLEIEYTALSLVAPEKNRFRYKLEGFDRDWQDVGTRRQAYYNNLTPGTYRFRVIAANNSGVWNESGATLAFSIAAAYYQTRWFLVLSIASVIALAWTAHRVRLRIVERHEREISALNERTMKAQEQERIRIAGELHDGVMQDMLAATMMLGTAKRRIPEGSDAIATIDKVQQKLIQAGTDLRQLSHDLHPPLLQEAGLTKAVQSYCEEFSAASTIPVSCEVDETASELSRGSALTLFRILQEALGNAAKHARAARIIVRLRRENGSMTLVVSDNGVGLNRSALSTGSGLGLVMMRERAMQLNGQFDFDSAPGRGTTIRVTIPFR